MLSSRFEIIGYEPDRPADYDDFSSILNNESMIRVAILFFCIFFMQNTSAALKRYTVNINKQYSIWLCLYNEHYHLFSSWKDSLEERHLYMNDKMLSEGKYSECDSSISMCDKKIGFRLNAKKMSDGKILFVEGFEILKGITMTECDCLKAFWTGFDHLKEFDSDNLKKTEFTPSMYVNWRGCCLVFKSDGTYMYYSGGLLLTKGTWEARMGNVIMNDSTLGCIFEMEVYGTKLYAKKLPGLIYKVFDRKDEANPLEMFPPDEKYDQVWWNDDSMDVID